MFFDDMTTARYKKLIANLSKEIKKEVKVYFPLMDGDGYDENDSALVQISVEGQARKFSAYFDGYPSNCGIAILNNMALTSDKAQNKAFLKFLLDLAESANYTQVHYTATDHQIGIRDLLDECGFVEIEALRFENKRTGSLLFYYSMEI